MEPKTSPRFKSTNKVSSETHSPPGHIDPWETVKALYIVPHALGREYSNEFRSPRKSANLPPLLEMVWDVGSQAGTYQPAHKASFEQTPVGQNNHTRGNNNKKRRTVISDQTRIRVNDRLQISNLGASSHESFIVIGQSRRDKGPVPYKFWLPPNIVRPQSGNLKSPNREYNNLMIYQTMKSGYKTMVCRSPTHR